jgi:hypothetical protein
MSVLVDQAFFCHFLRCPLQVSSFMGIKGGLDMIIADLNDVKTEQNKIQETQLDIAMSQTVIQSRQAAMVVSQATIETIVLSSEERGAFNLRIRTLHSMRLLICDYGQIFFILLRQSTKGDTTYKTLLPAASKEHESRQSNCWLTGQPTTPSSLSSGYQDLEA